MTELLTLSLKESPAALQRKAHFSHLYPQSCSLGRYPKLVTIGEGRNEDQLVNRDRRNQCTFFWPRNMASDLEVPIFIPAASHSAANQLELEVTDRWSQQDHIICKEQRPAPEVTKPEPPNTLAAPRNSVHKAMNRMDDKGQSNPNLFHQSTTSLVEISSTPSPLYTVLTVHWFSFLIRPVGSHNTFGSAGSNRHPPPLPEPTHHQVMVGQQLRPSLPPSVQDMQLQIRGHDYKELWPKVFWPRESPERALSTTPSKDSIKSGHAELVFRL